ncbi:MAG: arylsulfatase [Kiritimatiellae bacterium]|nr:arylsulfatase [Kiritimatiellia bacterium]
MGFGAAALALPGWALAAERRRKPNIVLILCDDMGFSDIGCYGGEVSTPNLDRLAAGGVRFSQFYNSARCCPTRASLLTGLHPHQAGVGWMTGNLGFPAYQGALNDRCVTIADVLRQAGYRTCASGKWHVGARAHPLDRGFDEYYGLIDGACNYFRPKEGIFRGKERVKIPQDGSYYTTDAFTEHAVQFVDRAGRDTSRPFFLYLAYTAPHYPIQVWQREVDKYRGSYRKGWDAIRAERYRRLIEMGLIDPKWRISPRDGKNPAWDTLRAEQQDWRDLLMATYAGMIDRMDQGVGKVLRKLEEVGADQDTLIMFLSDNGGCPYTNKPDEPERGPGGQIIPTSSPEMEYTYGWAWANASNTPFRRYKQHTHEGGISTPFIAHWPGVVKPGAITHQVGHIVDVMATCADVAGAAYPAAFQGRSVTPMEGKSLVPVFQGRQRAGHEHLCWNHIAARAVRRGKWKLVSTNEKSWELYDMEADRTELNNLVTAQPERVKELDALYGQWAARVGVVPIDTLKEKRRALRRKPAGRAGKAPAAGDAE